MSSTYAPAGSQITIIKEGTDPAFNGADKISTGYTVTQPTIAYSMPSGPGTKGGRRRTRTFPKSILRKTSRILPSYNPSKSPPTRKSVKLFTTKGVESARKTAKARASKTDITTIRKRLIEKKIISPEKKNIPASILRTLYADSVGAGLLS